MATTVNVPSVYPPGSNVSITGAVVSGQTVVGGVEGHLFGTPVARATTALSLGGVGSAQGFGTVTIRTAVRVTVGGVLSAQSFGVAVARNAQFVPVGGITSASAFGALKLAVSFSTGGVPSAQSFGTPKLNQVVQVQGVWPNWWFPYLPSITGGVISGDGHVVGGIGGPGGGIGHPSFYTWIGVPIGGVGSAAQFGSVRIVQIVHPLGVPSAAAFGTRLGWKLGVWGIPSAGQIGQPLVYKVLILPSPPGSVILDPSPAEELDLVAAVCQPLTLAASACQPLTLSASVCVEDEELLVASPVDRS